MSRQGRKGYTVRAMPTDDDLRGLPQFLLDCGDLRPRMRTDVSINNPYAAAFAQAVRPIVTALDLLAAADPRGRCTSAAPAPAIYHRPTFSFDTTKLGGCEPSHLDVFGPQGLKLMAVFVQASRDADDYDPAVGLVLPRWATQHDAAQMNYNHYYNAVIIRPDGRVEVRYRAVSLVLQDVVGLGLGSRTTSQLTADMAFGTAGSTVADRNAALGFPDADGTIARSLQLLPDFIVDVARYRESRT
jgi:hypothetical protein